jgi:hypothetical protein
VPKRVEMTIVRSPKYTLNRKAEVISYKEKKFAYHWRENPFGGNTM